MSRSTRRQPDEPLPFVSRHGHVLIALSADPTLRLRDLAALIGVTERSLRYILNDLQDAGYLTRTKIGRRNHHTVTTTAPLRHQALTHHTIGELIAAMAHQHDRHPPPAGDTPSALQIAERASPEIVETSPMRSGDVRDTKEVRPGVP